jgi:phosphate transport system permease protein
MTARQSSLQERAIRIGTGACAFGVALVTVLIALTLLSQAVPFLKHLSLRGFFAGTEWSPSSTPPRFGILPLLSGTLLVTFGAALLALPVGILNAIYLSEYAGSTPHRIIKPPLELLAAIPTVVYGYIGLFLVTPLLRMASDQFQASNAAAASIVVGIMVLPMVSSLAEDALAAVPGSLREGGYALGLTKAEVTLRLVVPAAASGIGATFLLALSRVVGETMAVTLAAGSTPNLTLDPRQSVATLTSYMVTAAQGDAPIGSVRYSSIFVLGLLLFCVTLGANTAATRLIAKMQERLSK